MYMPSMFNTTETAHALALMQAYPFASLISTDDEGLPFASHLPLHVQPDGAGFRLLGHCAKANPQWRYLEQRPLALVTFLGPHAYQSPAVYPDLTRVPTWNYLAVHCKVQAHLIHEADAKDRLLKQLIADHEPGYADQWRALDRGYQERMLGAIVAFELQVQSWECKLKLNQHRPESHAAMRAGYAQGNDHEQALGAWMDKLGLDAH